MSLNKEEFIARYGEGAWRRYLDRQNERRQASRLENPEKARENDKKEREKYSEQIKRSYRNWYISNPEKREEGHHEHNRKGGKYYEWKLKYQRTGIPGERKKVRTKHGKQYRPYKAIIAPDSQLHHEWVPDTSEYRGVALVETNAHQYGIIDVIQILDGKITLLTEEQIKKGV